MKISMRILLVAALVVAFAIPVFAQATFPDIPVNHWAYDAVKQLADKGLVIGYPDGTFRGNRTLTRYEMAMIIARMLPLIEAAKVVPAEVPEIDLTPYVTKEDLATIEKLVVEFADELASLGVRVTAAEDKIKGLQADIVAVKDFAVAVKDDVEMVKGDVAANKEDISSLLGELAGLKDALDTLKAQVADLAAIPAPVVVDLSEVEARIAELEAKIAELEAALGTIDISALEVEIEAIKAEIMAEMEAMKAEIMAMIPDVPDIEGVKGEILAELYAALDEIEGKIAELEAEMPDVDALKAEIMAEMDTMMADIIAMIPEMPDMEAFKAEMMAEMDAMKVEIIAMIPAPVPPVDVEALKTEIMAELDAVEAGLIARLGALEAEIMAVMPDVEALKAEIMAEVEAIIAEILIEIEIPEMPDMEAFKAEIMAEVEAMIPEMPDMGAFKAEIMAEMEAMKVEIIAEFPDVEAVKVEITAELDTIMLDIDAIRVEIEVLKKDVAGAFSDIKAVKEFAVVLRGELTDLQAAQEELQAELMALADEVSKLEAEVAKIVPISDIDAKIEVAISPVQSDILYLKDALVKVSEDIAALKKESEMLKAQLAAITEQVNTNKADIIALGEQIVAFNIEELEARVTTVEGEVETIKADIEGIKEELTRIKVGGSVTVSFTDIAIVGSPLEWGALDGAFIDDVCDDDDDAIAGESTFQMEASLDATVRIKKEDGTLADLSLKGEFCAGAGETLTPGSLELDIITFSAIGVAEATLTIGKIEPHFTDYTLWNTYEPPDMGGAILDLTVGPFATTLVGARLVDYDDTAGSETYARYLLGIKGDITIAGITAGLSYNSVYDDVSTTDQLPFIIPGGGIPPEANTIYGVHATTTLGFLNLEAEYAASSYDPDTTDTIDASANVEDSLYYIKDTSQLLPYDDAYRLELEAEYYHIGPDYKARSGDNSGAVEDGEVTDDGTWQVSGAHDPDDPSCDYDYEFPFGVNSEGYRVEATKIVILADLLDLRGKYAVKDANLRAAEDKETTTTMSGGATVKPFILEVAGDYTLESVVTTVAPLATDKDTTTLAASVALAEDFLSGLSAGASYTNEDVDDKTAANADIVTTTIEANASYALGLGPVTITPGVEFKNVTYDPEPTPIAGTYTDMDYSLLTLMVDGSIDFFDGEMTLEAGYKQMSRSDSWMFTASEMYVGLKHRLGLGYLDDGADDPALTFKYTMYDVDFDTPFKNANGETIDDWAADTIEAGLTLKF